ncbi:MAG: class I SAM-dependent methyltransferase [Candidatus Sulfotelmatobacter sp.]
MNRIESSSPKPDRQDLEARFRGGAMRVLDVGCGVGKLPALARLSAGDWLLGVDLRYASLQVAKQTYPQREFLCCRAERLPFAAATFDRVISSLAMPYTDIPRVLAEVRRVLPPGGLLFMSLHDVRFTLSELRTAMPRPIPTLYRLYVLANGLMFHVSGRVVPFPNGRIESFQTERGLRLALQRAGFGDVVIKRPDGRFLVEARQSGVSVQT